MVLRASKVNSGCLFKSDFPRAILVILRQIHGDREVVYRSCRNIEALKLKVSFLGNSVRKSVAFRSPDFGPYTVFEEYTPAEEHLTWCKFNARYILSLQIASRERVISIATTTSSPSSSFIYKTYYTFTLKKNTQNI